jgi:hypothetical protein
MDEIQNTTTTKTKAMTSSTFIKDNMLIDPSIQKEIIRRAVAGAFGDNPKRGPRASQACGRCGSFG